MADSKINTPFEQHINSICISIYLYFQELLNYVKIIQTDIHTVHSLLVQIIKKTHTHRHKHKQRQGLYCRIRRTDNSGWCL